MPGLGNGSGKFALSVGWRYAKAKNSYFNSRLNHEISENWQARERLSILDVTARYRVNSRFNALVTMPVVMNNFNMLFPPARAERGRRHGWGVSGVGDINILAQGWVLDPKKHPFGNAQLGVGLKIPTGNYNYQANMPDISGRNFRDRAVYPAAIMPGDGGLGVIVGYDAYKTLRSPSILRSVTVYSAGNYLINARNTNGTLSIIPNLGVPLSPYFANRLVNSVADGYAMEVGLSWRPPYVWDKPWLKGLRLRAFGKCEGLNSRDLFGRNDGFRQPGYAMSVGPGVTYSHGRDTLIAEVPIVFNRHINPGATNLPGPADSRGRPAPFNANRQFGLVAPLSVSIRYVRSF